MKMSKQIINGQEFDVHDDGAIRYDEAQTLTPEEKAQARENIGAAAVGEGGGGTGLTDAARVLLINILRNGVFTSDQSANITALEKALATNPGGGEVPDTPDVPDTPVDPDVTLASIVATYSGGDVAIGTALNKLTGIVVNAIYSDGSTATVTDYTLSGEIAEGENTITVTYEGKTATFTVTGVDASTEVIDLVPYLKAENKNLTTFYQGNTIRWADANGFNVYCVPVEAGTYRMSGQIELQYDTNGFGLQGTTSDKIDTSRLPLLAQDTDLSTNSISYTEAASCTHAWEGEAWNFTSILDITFDSPGYFLFSINTAQNVTLAKVVA